MKQLLWVGPYACICTCLRNPIGDAQSYVFNDDAWTGILVRAGRFSFTEPSQSTIAMKAWLCSPRQATKADMREVKP